VRNSPLGKHRGHAARDGGRGWEDRALLGYDEVKRAEPDERREAGARGASGLRDALGGKRVPNIRGRIDPAMRYMGIGKKSA